MTTETKDSTGVVVTAVATPVPDIESQKQQQAAAAAAADSSVDENAGKCLGIAMFVLLVVGFIFNFLIPIVSFICIIIVIVMASTITCGCCCASDYNLKPHVKRWATATLLCLVLMFVVQIIGFVAVAAAAATEVSNTGTFSQSSMDDATVGVLVVLALSIVLNFVAMIFSAIFTWGRGYGAPRS